jgi:hypothetical protein
LIERKVPAADAENILQLLHSFSDADLAQPETCEVLIDYLAHARLAIRGLAYWHLYRLVPGAGSWAIIPSTPSTSAPAPAPSGKS